MDKNPLNQGVFTAHGRGIGVASKKMIRERAAEIALLHGRQPHELDPADLEQAKRELSGGPEVDPETALLESLDESVRAGELPDTPAEPVHESPLEDEDEEGRSVTEQLVEEGAQEAARDQQLEAVRQNQKEAEAEP